MLDVYELETRMKQAGYVPEPGLTTSIALMDVLSRPLLLEGDAGVGKTEVGKMLAALHDCGLIRLQCYEGLDANSAIYEWNYQHQLLAIKLHESEHTSRERTESEIFSERYLLRRPLLAAITQAKPPVLLIDEIDRADEQFEAFLLEILSDFQVSIPELGTITAVTIPRVVLTSNGTRELSDALRRRCLYYYLDYPSFEKEISIVQMRLPNIDQVLSHQAISFVRSLREKKLRKNPGVAETLDWVSALANLKRTGKRYTLAELAGSLVCLLKTREDRDRIGPETLQRLAPKLVANLGTARSA